MQQEDVSDSEPRCRAWSGDVGSIVLLGLLGFGNAADNSAYDDSDEDADWNVVIEDSE